MAKSLSFSELIVTTAKQKAEAGQARTQPSLGLERPRDIILAASSSIAAELKSDGFSFLKSGPSLKQQGNDLTFLIHFQSDRNNIAGRRAAVWIHAGVSSKKLAKWRGSHESKWVKRTGPYAGSIGGGQIGNLRTASTWMEWDFANQLMRQDEIRSAVEAIRQIILPFFAMFENPAESLDALIHYRLHWQPSLLEFALSTINREAAEVAGRSFLASNPVTRDRFDAAFEKFSDAGLPSYRSDLGSDLAALAMAANLDLRKPN